MEMKKVINVGYIGWLSHDVTDFCRAHSVCDLNEEKIRKYVEKHPEVKGYSDYRKMAEDPDVDAVVISTPNWLHCEMAEVFLAKGKHVFCEKPMGVNRPEMDRMLAAQRRSRKQLAIDFEMRASSGTVALKQKIDGGLIGTVRGIDFVHHRGCWEAEGNGIWRTDPERSGGLFFMEICHEVDFFRYLFGEITHVQSFKFPNTLPQYPEGKMPDNVQTHFFFENGVMGSISSSHAISAHCPKIEEYPEHGHDMFFVVYGTEGALRLDAIKNTCLVVKHQPYPVGSQGVRVQREQFERYSDPHAFHDIDGNRLAFLKSCAEGRPHVQDAYDAWKTHCVCLAAEKSALRGFRKIAVDYRERG
jgi:predicted dehydrogenase